MAVADEGWVRLRPSLNAAQLAAAAAVLQRLVRAALLLLAAAQRGCQMCERVFLFFLGGRGGVVHHEAEVAELARVVARLVFATMTAIVMVVDVNSAIF